MPGGEKACPPEDSGGVDGYYELLKILANPKHKEHKDYREWIGGKFDPDEFDLDDVNDLLHPSADHERLGTDHG